MLILQGKISQVTKWAENILYLICIFNLLPARLNNIILISRSGGYLVFDLIGLTRRILPSLLTLLCAYNYATILPLSRKAIVSRLFLKINKK
jgi:hypothetical protein